MSESNNPSRTRTCLGCEGGRQVPAKDAYGWIAAPVTCPACLGSGSVTERMGFDRHGEFIADAVADAETLLDYAFSRPHGDGTLEAYLDSALGHGDSVAAEMLGGDPAPCPCGCGTPAKRWSFAERAARSAFRAVPALKGESL
jgi:hypothetical protein